MRSNFSRKRYSSEICHPDSEILIQQIAVEIARWLTIDQTEFIVFDPLKRISFIEETGTRSYLKFSRITNAIESDFLQGNIFPGFSDNSTLLIKVIKGFGQRPQKIFLTSLIQKANNLIGKCIETAQFSEFATFFCWYIRPLLERISQGRMTNVNVCFSVLIPPPPLPSPQGI